MNPAADLFVVEMPMQRPFVHALAERRVARSLMVALRDEGHVGFGEGLPRCYVTGESLSGALTALLRFDFDRLRRSLDWSSFHSLFLSLEALDLPSALAPGRRMPAAAAALELAVLDLAGRRFGEPLSAIPARLGAPSGSNGPRSGPFPITRVLDFSEPVENLAAEAGALRHVKVKVGRDPGTDTSRLHAVRSILGGERTLSVDANQAFTLPEAVRRIKAWEPFGIAWYEEPLAGGDWIQLGRLRAETGIRILLDESAAPPFPEPGPEYAQACDAVNLRISRCGGFLAALRECEWIRARGLGFQLGIHVGEMGPSWAAGRHFIAGVEGAIAYEAGQADRWFPTRIFSPAPGVDRTTYLGWPLPGPGLGLRPTPALGACVRDAYRWDENAGRWSPVSGWTAPEEWEAEAEHA